MKMIKRISLLLAVALAALCLGVFASACGQAKDFTITVYYSDGTTVVDGTAGTGYYVQICYFDTDKNELVNCYSPDEDNIDEGKVGKDGKAVISIANVQAQAPSGNIKYEVHVLTTEALELKQAVYVTADNPTANAVLKDVSAPAK